MKPMLKAHRTKRLNIKYDVPLTNFAYKIELRSYHEVDKERCQVGGAAASD
jgi:hypothetical protein